ncbi:MAG: ABC transporter ATP-binding protein [Ignavibacteriaceae bacterium]
MSFIEIKNIVKEYLSGGEKVAAVNDISLDIRQGDFVSVMGQSGSGKSTLLGILGALTHPTSGTVVTDEIELFKLSSEKLAAFRREYLGFVFQSYQLIPYLTVLENTLLPLVPGEYSKTEQKEKAFSILDKLHLSDKANRLTDELSGGEQQRVAIARALVNDPYIILADEPTGNLDSKTSREIMHLFCELNDEGKTIVMVTHNEEIEKFANKKIYLKDGKINGGD